MGIRKNQKELTAAEWTTFIDAIDSMHGTSAPAPAYRRFVALHVSAMNMSNMDWAVHTMNMPGMHMVGRNFFAWHRRLVQRFEQRLQLVHPTVTVPYWDSVTDRAIPAAISDPALLARWSVVRNWDPTQLAAPADLMAIKTFTGTYTAVQALVEGVIHNSTHRAVGGDMAGSASPTDPLFWLHHAFIDKTWADWQASPNGKAPPNVSETLKPPSMQAGVGFGVKVSSLLDITALGYSYI